MNCKICGLEKTIFAKGLCRHCYDNQPKVKAKMKEYYSKPEVKARMKEYYSKHSEELKAKMKEYHSKPEVKARTKECSKKQFLKKQRQNLNWRPKPSFEERMNKAIALRAEYLKKRGIRCKAILPKKYLTQKAVLNEL